MIVEFALMLPITLLALMMVVELNHAVLVHQKISGLSREAAAAAFRDCAVLQQPELQTCLTNVGNMVLDAGDRLFPDFDQEGGIIMSIYEYDNATGNTLLKIQWPGASSNNFATHYDAARIDPAVIADQKVLAIGEAFYRRGSLTPIAPFMQRFGTDPVNAAQNAQLLERVYEATIY